jgi:hypothetical protein
MHVILLACLGLAIFYNLRQWAYVTELQQGIHEIYELVKNLKSSSQILEEKIRQASKEE